MRPHRLPRSGHAVREIPLGRTLHAVAAVLRDPHRHLRQQRTRAASVQESLLESTVLEQLEYGRQEAAGQIHAARGHEGHREIARKASERSA